MQELRDLRTRLLDLDLEKVDATVAGSTAVAVVDQKRAILQARITALQGEIVNERMIIAGGTVVVIAGGVVSWTVVLSSPSSSKKLTADEQRLRAFRPRVRVRPWNAAWQTWEQAT